MRIGIDMLGNQSSSRNRGIGRYTRNLVSQLLARHPQHEYVLYHYEGLPGMDDAWPGSPQLRLVCCDAVDGTLRECAEQIAANRCDRIDVLLQTTPLECYRGHMPPAKTLGGPKLAAILYDLIPMLFQDLYLREVRYSQLYYQAIRQLRQYDVLLAISEASRRDGMRVLDMSPEQVVTIGAASSREFFFPDRSQPVPEATHEVLRRFGIAGEFVYCLSGLDARKNLLGLMQAFALLKSELRLRHQLVITCSMSADEHVHWHEQGRKLDIQDRLVLTNFIPDEVIRILYQRCSAFVFPSLYEGFGLPILEAMHCGAPVAAGRNSSQEEVVGEAGLLIEAESPTDICAKLTRLLEDTELVESLRVLGPRRAQDFSWESTADRAIEALERTVRNCKAPWRKKARVMEPKRRIAYFSPLPPKRSGISDYSQALLAELRRHYVVDLYHEPGYVPHLSLASPDFACHDYRLFARYDRALSYRGVVYQMGNSKYHGFVYETLLRRPGVVVLHDLVLTGFHYWYGLQPQADPDHFAAELGRENPALAGEYLLNREQWGLEPGGVIGACNRRGARLSGQVLAQAAGVIVHDVWGAQQIRQRSPHLADLTAVVPHGAEIRQLPYERRAEIRHRFGLPDDALLFGCFGILHRSKCNVEAIQAFAAVASRHPKAILFFVGQDLGEGEAQATSASLGLQERVRFFGHAPISTFRDLAAASDIGINLRRPPTNGETSGALLTLLSAGAPTIVIDVDTFSSYPDDVVRKVSWSADPTPAIERAMLELAGHIDRRTRLGRTALNYVRQNHSWSHAAELYVESIEHAFERECAERRLAAERSLQASNHAAA
jgi:glycosyltransferase involved in cell wall biosynthesis